MPGSRRLEVVSGLGPTELLAAVVRTCPMSTTWPGVGEVRVEPFGRGDTAVGLVVGRADRAPRAVVDASTRVRGGCTVLTVGGLERRGRPWTPWSARAYRAVHEQFLDALVVELGQVDPGASVSHAPGVVPEGTGAASAGAGSAGAEPPAEGGAPVQRERREVRPRTRDPRTDGL